MGGHSSRPPIDGSSVGNIMGRILSALALQVRVKAEGPLAASHLSLPLFL